MEKKVYVLTVSEYFPAYHPRRGESTGFEYKIKNGIKIHTIRANYNLWKKRIDEINAGLAILSIRKWSGKPRRSKQVEIMQMDKAFMQELSFNKEYDGDDYLMFASIDNFGLTSYKILAKNDGLSPDDWLHWFKNYDFDKPMAIIHFTEFRY